MPFELVQLIKNRRNIVLKKNERPKLTHFMTKQKI